jgi:hypothetical protein
MNDIAGRMRYAGGQPAGVRNFTGFAAGVIGRGLHKAELEESETVDNDSGLVVKTVKVVEIGDKVGEKWIQKHVSSRVQKKLFDKLMEMSGLSDRAEELAGNG